MSEYQSIYQVLTPFGAFEAIFGEEDTPVEYRGNEPAIQFFKDYLIVNQLSGEHGNLLNPDRMEPDELYGFCQPEGSGISVMPPFDDLLAYAEEDAADNEEKRDYNHEEINQPILDSTMQISGIEKVKLAKELNGIRGTIQAVSNGLEKLKLAKRIGEIRVLLGGKQAEEFNPTTPEGYAKIKGIANMELRYQDVLDSFFQSRIGAVREALRDLGWEGRNPKEARLYKAFNGNDAEAQFTFKNVGAGANVVGYSVNEMADDLTKTPEQFASEIDAAVAAEIASRQTPAVDPIELPQDLSANESDLSEDERYEREDHGAVLQSKINAWAESEDLEIQLDLNRDDQDLDPDWDGKISLSSDAETLGLYGVDLEEFKLTAYLVSEAVKEYGGTVVWGNFDASAYTGSVFDDARGGGNILEVVAYTNGKRGDSMSCAQFRKRVGAHADMNLNDVIERENKLRADKGDHTVFVVEHTAAGQAPLFKLKKGIFDSAVLDSVVSLGSIVGQIADKEGSVVARVRIEHNGVLTVFKGEQGLEQVASPTAAVAKINAVIDIVFGGADNKISNQENKPEVSEETIVIATFKDVEDNMEARVAKIKGGYSVTLKDLDSGEVVPFGTIYPDEQTAIAKAKEAAHIKENIQPTETTSKATMADVNNVMPLIKQFIGKAQLAAMGAGIRGEEGQFFKDKFIEVAKIIEGMPKSYETDGQADKAVAYLHYFKGSGDWYITEKDAGDDEDAKNGISGQVQAFGMADLGHGGELGYISIKELIEANVELDLYWMPKTLAVIKGKDDEPETKNEPVPVPANSDVADPSASGETGQNADAGEANGEQSSPEVSALAENQGNPMKAAFEAELNALKLETDPDAFDKKLDEIAGRIEAAGLMSELDAELNAAADVLSDLLAKAEAA
jgi:hypothetical protein